MEILFEMLKINPGAYFLAGLALGYILRGLMLEKDKKKPAGRYHSPYAGHATRKRAPVKLGKEPSFDWMNRGSANVSHAQPSAVAEQPSPEI